ncbi:hypothetical protein M2175_001214 [Bradyrhizobium elkanii]|uniref:hypothetical protein n=1 Tax=Bradyrhizobium TaxID=374 RepID=UPI00216852E3|nr:MULTISPECIES: hypothetical protein [Bradyrhizobium]MCS3926183.1 hypothetical protein [Bradyrhizobium elkanii]MCS3966735.1 hypothetical protein [Bradyrhizobium japonicum]
MLIDTRDMFAGSFPTPQRQLAKRRHRYGVAAERNGFSSKGTTVKRFAGPICVTAVMLTACQARAGETPFGWIYTADVHPQGTFEYEHKSFMQLGQSQGQYFFM